MSDMKDNLQPARLPCDSERSLVPVPSQEMQFVGLRGLPRSRAVPEQASTLHFVLTVLRRWWMVATPVGLLLAGVAGGGVYWLFVPVYEASAWFKIEDRTPFLAFESRDEGRSKAFFQTQIETIRSPLVLSQVVKRPEIAQAPEIAPQPNKVAWLSKQIKVMSVGESELFRIVYSSPDPSHAANLVNAVTQAYFKLRDQSEGERNQRVIDLLEQEKEKRSKEVMRLRETLSALAGKAAEKDPFSGKAEADALRHPLAELETRLITVQVERTILEARIKAAEEQLELRKKGEKSEDAEDGPTSKQDAALRDAMVERILESDAAIQKHKLFIVERQSRLSEIEQISKLGKKDAAYQQMVREIDRDQQTLEKLRADLRPRIVKEAELAIVTKRTEMEAAQVANRMDDLAKLRSDLGTSHIMERVLQERSTAQRQQVKQSSGDTMELGFRKDELARAEKVFELIAQRTLQLQTERGAPARVTLMREADVPAAPVEVFPYRNIALASMAGLCLPFGLAFLWERLMRRVTNSQVLEMESHLTVLGEIARLPARAPLKRAAAASRPSYDLRIFEESIDSLRTSLTLCEELAGMRIVAVTSAVNHEGKTSVAAQLAVSLARATGQATLLIDGDMRSPDIHNIFQIPLEPGLAQVLGGQCTFEEAVNTTWSNHVHLLPAGRIHSSPHQLLGNGAWRSLLSKIPDTYRYVVLDTPPVLSASEALVLAKAADASLVCVMRDVSRIDQVRKTCERLAAAGGRPVGAVLNGVPTKHYAYRYGTYEYAPK